MQTHLVLGLHAVNETCLDWAGPAGTEPAGLFRVKSSAGNRAYDDLDKAA